MRLLLDTHALLWWLLDDPAMPAPPRRAIERAEAVFVSAASVWEIGTTQRLGKLPELAVAATELPGLIRDSRCEKRSAVRQWRSHPSVLYKRVYTFKDLP